MRLPFRALALYLGLAALASPALADALFDSGKLLATGGVSQVEGAGGGGLASWAMITGYGTRNGIGANLHYTAVPLPDYNLQTAGLAVGLYDRLELSYAWQGFDTQEVGGALGLGRGFVFHQNIFGAKLKILGDAVYDQDSPMPQIAVGLQHKENDRAAVIHAVGGRNSTGTDFYMAASKLFLAESLLVNATLRATKANQFGLLGFGGNKHNDYTVQFEGSAAYLFSRQLAAGVELRTRPSNLSVAHEGEAWDLFAAYFFNKNLSLTAAYADLGNIVIKNGQHGAYLSLQAGF